MKLRMQIAVGFCLAAAPLGMEGQTPSDSVTASADFAHADSGSIHSAAVYVPLPGVAAGSDREERLRTLQLLGVVPLHQWSVRALGARELERLTIGDTAMLPVSGRYGWCQSPCGGIGRQWWSAGMLPAAASAWFNSTSPFGMNDGPVWAGRGLTVSAHAGIHGRVGPLSLVLAPVVMWAQNQEFPLEPNGQTGDLRFGDAFLPDRIDHPQRFGNEAYARLDPGESTLRLDVAGIAAGISSASQWWGPMTTYPYMMGNNAGGFPHVFAGTSQPANIGIGQFHFRVIYGDLAQSDYSPMPSGRGRRLASGVAAVFLPRGVRGLEIGGSRFFASVWPDDGIRAADLAKPFRGLLKLRNGLDADGRPREDAHNQLASVFARLALPASGVEIYGEYGRDDHNADLRDFWLEPDHDATYGMGLRRAWRSGPAAASVFTAELVNFRISHLQRAREQSPPYVHTQVRQGHTLRGQPLGIGIGARSGDALTLSLRRYGAGRSSAYSFSRHGEAAAGEGASRLVRLIAAAERSVRRGPLDIVAGISVTQRVGREEARGGTNLGISLQTRWQPGASGP